MLVCNIDYVVTYPIGRISDPEYSGIDIMIETDIIVYTALHVVLATVCWFALETSL